MPSIVMILALLFAAVPTIDVAAQSLPTPQSTKGNDPSTIRDKGRRVDLAQVREKFFVVPSGSSVVVNVPSQKATLQEALNAIREWVIPPGAEVQIHLADGTYDFTAGVGIFNAYGNRLLIVGNTANPSRVVLRTSNAFQDLYHGALFYVGAGSSVAFDGVLVRHTNSSNQHYTSAFLADNGGYIELRGKIIVDGFDWNIFARRGGVVAGFSGGISRNASDGNVVVYQGGIAHILGWELSGASHPTSPIGSGAVNEGGSLDITGSRLTRNKYAGLHNVDGYTRAGRADFSNNTTVGIRHDAGMILFDPPSTAGGNGTYGYYRTPGARTLIGGLKTLTEGIAGPNGTALFLPYIEDFYDGRPGDRVVSPKANESRQHDTKGTGAHYFRINGSTKVAILNEETTFASAITSLSLRASSPLPKVQNCGANPPVAAPGSTNNSGQFTMGSGKPTACTVTFANAYPARAYCTVTPVNEAAVATSVRISSSSASAFTVALGAGTDNATFNYTCVGN